MVLIGLLVVAVAGFSVSYFIVNKQANKVQEKQVDSDVTHLNDKIKELEDSCKELSDNFNELTESYESTVEQNRELSEILDGQEAQVLCPCSENTFLGVFVPNQDNLVECSKCGEAINIVLAPTTSVMPSHKTTEQIFDEVSTLKEKEGE